MSDKPKPGKDKDIRCVRQAMEATQQLFCLLSNSPAVHTNEQVNHLCTEMLLIVLDQLDELDQMLFDPTMSPLSIIEQNRQVRQLTRQLMQTNGYADQTNLFLFTQYIGNQLTSLLVIKEIRMYKI